MEDEFPVLLHLMRRVDLSKIEEVCGRADGVIVASQVQQVRDAVEHARALFRKGEESAAMEAGQAAWNLANGLHNALESKNDVQVGRRARKQRRDAGITSGEERAAERQPEWDRWQAEVDAIRVANRHLQKTTVQARVAEKFKVSRTSIDKRTQWR